MTLHPVFSGMTARAIIGASVLFGLYLTSRYSYLLFHALSELFSIVVGCSIFFIAWNARRFSTNNYVLIIGIGFLFTSLLDTLHTLSYRGMGAFPGYDADLPTQLWIAARYLGSLSFCIAPLLMGRRVRPGAVVSAYAAVTAAVLLSLFAFDVFPAAYREGTGLTAFKIASEYVITLIYAVGLFLLLRLRREFDLRVRALLSTSLLLQMAAELAFTWYVGVYDLSNLAGHFLKITAFYLFYKALIETALVRPYETLFRNLMQREREVSAERDRAQNYLDVARTIIVVIDGDQRVSLINRMGCAVLGLPEEQIVGRNWFDSFIPEAGRENVRTAFLRLMAGEVQAVGQFENAVLTSRGDERIIAWQNAVLRDDQGRIVATLSSGNDITERLLAENELARKTRELQRSNTELDQFATVVSHDLREPLLTIGGYAELLKERYRGRLDEPGRRHLERIVQGALRMERLINGVLAYARVTTRGQPLQPVDLNALVATVLEAMEHSARESGAVITADDLPRVMGDEVQLGQVLQNLLSNAIQNRREGHPPAVRISARTAGNAGREQGEEDGQRSGAPWWLVSVADDGIGIAPEDQERVFRLFERLQNGKEYAGTGVGLAVCRKIIERHGGRIWVASRPGAGTEVCFTLRGA